MFLLKAIVFVNIFYFGAAKSAKFGDDQNISHRIVGGVNAKEGSAPYQVSLQLGKGPSDYVIMAGTNKISEGSVFLTPDKFITHKRHDLPIYHNDIGLIRLKEEIEFTENIQPIDYEWREVPVDAGIKLTGWGRTEDFSLPDQLQEIYLTHISYEKCKEAHGDDLDYGHLCTYNTIGEGSCNGDSGGPLTYKGKVVAVVNFGIPCGAGFPDAHARVAYYHEWIRTNIAEYE